MMPDIHHTYGVWVGGGVGWRRCGGVGWRRRGLAAACLAAGILFLVPNYPEDKNVYKFPFGVKGVISPPYVKHRSVLYVLCPEAMFGKRALVRGYRPEEKAHLKYTMRIEKIAYDPLHASKPPAASRNPARPSAMLLHTRRVHRMLARRKGRRLVRNHANDTSPAVLSRRLSCRERDQGAGACFCSCVAVLVRVECFT